MAVSDEKVVKRNSVVNAARRGRGVQGRSFRHPSLVIKGGKGGLRVARGQEEIGNLSAGNRRKLLRLDAGHVVFYFV